MDTFSMSVSLSVALVSVLVGLYEEPEKPNNALEYPLNKALIYI